MKKKSLIIILIAVLVLILITLGIVTKYIDGGRVATNNEPKYCIKVVGCNGDKVTYWGLGYKVIRYVGVSPNEPYDNNIGVKMGSWFMKYELAEYKSINIELLTEGKTIQIDKKSDIESIVSLLKDSKYISELCDGINTYKIELEDEIYYIKDGCKEIQRGRKQAKISDEDFEAFIKIIEDNLNED